MVDATLRDLEATFTRESPAKRRVAMGHGQALLHIATKAAPEDKSTEEDWFFGVTRAPLQAALDAGQAAAVIACCGGSPTQRFVLPLTGPVGDLLMGAPVQANDQLKFNIVRRRDTGSWQLWARGPRLDLPPPRPLAVSISELLQAED